MKTTVASDPSILHLHASGKINYEDAKKYYDMVKVDDPTNIEAKIQFQYCKFMDCKKGEAYSFYGDYINVMKHAVDNVASSEMTLEEQIEFLSTSFDNTLDTMSSCRSCLRDLHIEGDDNLNKSSAVFKDHILFARDFGDEVAKHYMDSAEGMALACKAWKSFVDRINGNCFFAKNSPAVASIPAYVEKIKKVDPSYNFVEKSRGCL
jgi:superfamily II helicase